MKLEGSPDNDEWPPPLAAGLSDDDILQLLKLIRPQTDEKILSIQSEGENATVRTGIQDDPLAGAGHEFACVRVEQGWKIDSSSQWVS
jgi:hypothetical protein